MFKPIDTLHFCLFQRLLILLFFYCVGRVKVKCTKECTQRCLDREYKTRSWTTLAK